jgi:hypothetical protein
MEAAVRPHPLEAILGERPPHNVGSRAPKLDPLPFMEGSDRLRIADELVRHDVPLVSAEELGNVALVSSRLRHAAQPVLAAVGRARSRALTRVVGSLDKPSDIRCCWKEGARSRSTDTLGGNSPHEIFMARLGVTFVGFFFFFAVTIFAHRLPGVIGSIIYYSTVGLGAWWTAVRLMRQIMDQERRGVLERERRKHMSDVGRVPERSSTPRKGLE